MGHAFSWFLAIRYLRGRWINFLGILGVAVAVWAPIVVIAVFSGFISGIRQDVRRCTPDLLVTDLPARQSYEALRPTIEQDRDVAASAPRLRHYGTFYLRNTGNLVEHSRAIEFSHLDTNFVMLVGIDQGREVRATSIADWVGRAPRQSRPHDALHPLDVPLAAQQRGRQRIGLPVSDGETRQLCPGLLLGSHRVRNLPFLDIGDPIDLLTAVYDDRAGSKGEVKPLQKLFEYAGAFQTGHRLHDETHAYVPIEALRTMLGHDAEDDGSIDLITDVAINVVPGADLHAVAGRLQQALAPLVPGGKVSVLDWEEQNDVFLGATTVERAMMKIVLFVVMLIAAFLIYATLSMMVTQKVKDIGILGALGGAPASVGSVFVFCGFVIGVTGGLIGAGAGVLTTIWLNEILDALHLQLFPADMFDLARLPVELDLAWVVQVTLLALALSLLVAWLPARRAARMDPVQSLSYE